MQIYQQNADGTLGEPTSLETISMADITLLWVDIDEPSSAPPQLTGKDFKIDLPDFESLKQGAVNPRIQERPDDLLIVWSLPQRFDEESDRLGKSVVLIVVGEKYLVTLHSNLDELKQIREDYSHGDFESPLYSILDTTSLADLDLATEISKDIDQYLDSIIGASRKTGDRRRKARYGIDEIKRLKRRNYEIRKLVTLHRNVLLRLTRRGTRFVSADLARDLMDVLEQFWRIDDDVQNNSDLITSSLDIQLNVTMKRMTTIATIFLPLTFLVGLYGMNFKNMPELAWRFGYIFIWTAMIVIVLAMTIIARRKGWF